MTILVLIEMVFVNIGEIRHRDIFKLGASATLNKFFWAGSGLN